MEVKIGNRRLKMIDGKVCIVMLNKFGVEVKSGKFSPIKFSIKDDGYKICCIMIDGARTMLREHRIVWKLAHPDWDIFDSSDDNMIDHKNRKRDDNRIENLHVVNSQQNNWNTDAKGYSLDKRNGKYKAHIKINGVKKHLGTYDTEEEAHSSYLQGKIKYHGSVFHHDCRF